MLEFEGGLDKFLPLKYELLNIPWDTPHLLQGEKGVKTPRHHQSSSVVLHATIVGQVLRGAGKYEKAVQNMTHT